MKKTIKTVFAFILSCALLCVSVKADSGAKNWYFIRHGTDIPSFPDDSEILSSHGCYFVDTSAYTNGQKVIYLTFDAGYENGNVEKTLDILKENDVPAAFFVLSNIIKKNTELIKRMHGEGHLVCNHTKNHKDMTTLTDSEMASNLEALESLYRDTTGNEMCKYFRFPEGRYSLEKVMLLERLGYKTFFWSMAYADWDDAKQPNCDKAIEKILGYTHPGAVILLHPTSNTNVKVLPRLISEWRKQGYTFGTLDELVRNMSK